MATNLVVSFFVVAFVFSVSGQPLTSVYIGVDEASSSFSQANFLEILTNISFVVPSILNMDNVTAVSEAMSIMDVLILCPGPVPFTQPVGALVEQFVNDGGVLIYTSDVTGARANQVSQWFSAPEMDVTAISSVYTVDEYYSIFIEGSRGYFDYYNYYQGLPNSESLSSSFSRLSGISNKWGLPFKHFAPKMYYVDGSTYRMSQTSLNEPFCLFESGRNCWLFQFPRGAGFVIAIPFTFATPDALSELFVQRAAGFVAAACAANLEQEAFPLQNYPVLLQSYTYGDWNNLVYDLSLISDLYVWHDPNALTIMEEVLNRSSAVLRHFYYYEPIEYDGPIFYPLQTFNGANYRDFVSSGGNIAFIHDARGMSQLMNNYFGFLLYYGGVGTFNSYLLKPENGAFANIDNLPPVYYQEQLRGDNANCIFGDSTDCSLWSGGLGSTSGNVTFLSWDFSKQ